LSILAGIAQTVVYAAEKIFGAKMGKDKLEYDFTFSLDIVL
jgi:hypothetical protein